MAGRCRGRRAVGVGRTMSLFAVLTLLAQCGGARATPVEELLPVPAPPGQGDRAAGGPWTRADGNPIINVDRLPAGLPSDVARKSNMIWNDPSVLLEDGGYSMWASAGFGGPNGVAIYKLRSSDGLDWTVENGGRPVLEPGSNNQFDSLGVETPVVLKVGDTYHMYYSAYPHGKIPLVTLAHAVSSDGVRWEKRGELTSITGVVDRQNGNPWGWLGRGEPAAVYHEGTFYLYFTDVKCRQSNCRGTPAPIRGISLATSTNGHDFTQQGSEPIIMPSSSYPPSEGWEGYSTPWVLVADGKFELFCDVFRSIDGESLQTSLVRMQSDDGVRFTEVDAHLMVAGQESWAAMSVRSPSVVIDAGVWRMWYAGDNFDPRRNRPASGRLQAGIGTATLRD